MKQFKKFLFLAVAVMAIASEDKPKGIPGAPVPAYTNASTTPTAPTAPAAPTAITTATPMPVSDKDMLSFIQIRLEFEVARNTVLQMEGGCVSLPTARKVMDESETKMQAETERILKSAGCEAKKCYLDEFVDPTDKRKKLIVKRQFDLPTPAKAQ